MLREAAEEGIGHSHCVVQLVGAYCAALGFNPHKASELVVFGKDGAKDVVVGGRHHELSRAQKNTTQCLRVTEALQRAIQVARIASVSQPNQAMGRRKCVVPILIAL